jgi:hypothetical protein
VSTSGSLRITARHELVDEFVASFARWVSGGDEESLFVVTDEPRPLGMRLAFLIQLKGGAPVMRGEAEIVAAYRGGDGPRGQNGNTLRILEMDAGSREVFQRLVERAGRHDSGTAPPEVARFRRAMLAAGGALLLGAVVLIAALVAGP